MLARGFFAIVSDCVVTIYWSQRKRRQAFLSDVLEVSVHVLVVTAFPPPVSRCSAMTCCQILWSFRAANQLVMPAVKDPTAIVNRVHPNVVDRVLQHGQLGLVREGSWLVMAWLVMA